jgi:hypothetical protein
LKDSSNSIGFQVEGMVALAYVKVEVLIKNMFLSIEKAAQSLAVLNRDELLALL